MKLVARVKGYAEIDLKTQYAIDLSAEMIREACCQHRETLNALGVEFDDEILRLWVSCDHLRWIREGRPSIFESVIPEYVYQTKKPDSRPERSVTPVKIDPQPVEGPRSRPLS